MAEDLEEPQLESQEETITRIVEELLRSKIIPHRHRLWGMHNIVLGNPLWHPYFWTDIQSTTYPASRDVGDVVLEPIYFPAPMTISRMTCLLLTASVGFNFRLGLYRDNGGTPVGGALLADSGNIAATPIGVKVFTFPAPIVVTKGIPVWAALETQDNVMQFNFCDFIAGFIEVGAERMLGCTYTRGGGFGAFTDPCPAVSATLYARFWGFVRVDSVQPL